MSDEDIQKVDLGGGHRISTLEDVLYWVVSQNINRENQGEPNLIVNIELKNENVVEGTHSVINQKLRDFNDKGVLEKDNFIINSFHWDRLEQFNDLEQGFKLVPNLRTTTIFGKDKVDVDNGFYVKPNVPCCPKGLGKVRDLAQKIPLYAIDCVVHDLRTELVSLCKDLDIGLYTSLSSQRVDAGTEVEELEKLHHYSLEMTQPCYFKADQTSLAMKALSRFENKLTIE